MKLIVRAYLGVLIFGAMGMVSCGKSSGTAHKDPFLATYIQSEIARMNATKIGGTKMVQSGEEAENGRLDSIDWNTEMDGLLEFAQIQVEDTLKYGHWIEEGKNKLGMPLSIERYFAKDSLAHLQSVEIMWEGTEVDGVVKKQIQVLEWQFKENSWWMDRKVKAYYQPNKALGYEIKENAIWASPKEISVQISLDNPMYLDVR